MCGPFYCLKKYSECVSVSLKTESTPMIILFISLLLFSTPLMAQNLLIYTISQQGITLSAHIMPPAESSNLFLHNLHAYNICPLELVITNNTEKTWLISGNSIEQLALIAPNTITKDIIYKHYITAEFMAYACAIAGWLATIAGFSVIQESLPHFADATKYISAAATLFSFLYYAHRFTTYTSKRYMLTQAQIMQYGLSGTNVTIAPHTTVTFVMFLNNKSYMDTPAPVETFYYLFSVMLYNLYNSTDVITIPVEVPKIGII